MNVIRKKKMSGEGREEKKGNRKIQQEKREIKIYFNFCSFFLSIFCFFLSLFIFVIARLFTFASIFRKKEERKIGKEKDGR